MPLLDTTRSALPTVNIYGNTFARQHGTGIDDAKTKGEITPSSLGQSEIIGGVEFTSFERLVHDWVKARLGHPVIRVELSPFQILTCIQEAFTKLQNHAPLWANQFATFKSVAGVGLYRIPQYILDGLTYVVYKKTVLSIQSLAGTLEQDFFIRYFQENFIFSDFQVGDFYLLQTHLEMIRKVLGNEGSWDIVNNEYLQLFPVPVLGNEVVILQFRAIDTDHMHPAYRIWLQKYALAQAKSILGGIRGKYKTLPGPGGGTELNGAQLVQEAKDEIELLETQLMDEFEEGAAFSTY